MANKDMPVGAQPLGRIISANVYEAGSTIYPGDFVRLASDGQIDAAAAGETLIGVALGYATVGKKVLVSDAPEQRYVVQADEGQIDAQTDIGQNADILATAGSSAYKASRHELDSSTIAGSAAQCTILDIERRVGDELGTNVKVVVRINEHQLVDAFGGV